MKIHQITSLVIGKTVRSHDISLKGARICENPRYYVKDQWQVS